MDITTERQDGILSALVSGRIDGSNVVQFEETVRTAIEDGDRAVMMDLENLSYISSAGLRVVLLIAKNVWARDAKFALCAVSDQIRQVVEVSGFDKMYRLADSPTRLVSIV